MKISPEIWFSFIYLRIELGIYDVVCQEFETNAIDEQVELIQGLVFMVEIVSGTDAVDEPVKVVALVCLGAVDVLGAERSPGEIERGEVLQSQDIPGVSRM